MSASFSRLAPQSVAQTVAEQICQAIYTGRLNPGERVVETRVAKEMGVAQSSVREALQHLEHLGFIERIPNRGSYVVELDEEKNRQIYAVRSELERLVMELAPPRSTTGDVQHLRELLEQMREASRKRDVDTFVDADLQLHRYTWSLCGNPYLEKTLEILAAPQFAFYRIRGMRGQVNWEQMDNLMDEHEQIVERFAGECPKDGREIFQEMRAVVTKGIWDWKRPGGTS